MDGFGFSFDASYIRNQSFFLDGPAEVNVWVESDDDKRFWQPVFNSINSQDFVFKIMCASTFVSVDGKSANGCARLLGLYRSGDIELSEHSIFCLDSDHRFLASYAERYTGEDLRSGFIYWTMVHSKENAGLIAGFIQSVLCHVTFKSDHELRQGAAEFLNEFSCSVAGCVYLLGFLEGEFWEQDCDALIRFRALFSEILVLLKSMNAPGEIDFSSQSWQDFLSASVDLKERLSIYVDSLNRREAYQSYQAAVLEAGVTADKALFFVRGHDAYEVVENVFRKFCSYYKKEKLADIATQSATRAKQMRAEFFNQWIDFHVCYRSRAPELSAIPFFDITRARLLETYQ